MNLSKCFKYYNELDDDIKNLVLSKVRNPQNKKLLDDIVNFKKQKDTIYTKYLKNGFEYTDNYDDDFNIHAWIDNDLTEYYIKDSNINILTRQYCYKIKKEKKGEKDTIYNFYFNMKIDCKSKINRYIANLTIQEREAFINKK